MSGISPPKPDVSSRRVPPPSQSQHNSSRLAVSLICQQAGGQELKRMLDLNEILSMNPKFVGINSTVYYLLCGSLFLGFEVTAFCRLFDVGPFVKRNRDHVTKTTNQ